MNSRESIVKIVTQYFAPMTRKPFEFRGKVYEPKTLRVSPMIFTRRMGCPPMCGGCCAKLSVEYLATESPSFANTSYEKADGSKPDFQMRLVELNGITQPIFSDLQKKNTDHFCHYLNQKDGRCNIHGSHPFSCDFELLRFSIMSRPDRANQLNHRPFGRGWAMLTVDGTRGAKCTWEDTDKIQPEEKRDIVRKLRRLKAWMEYWELEHKVDEVIEWVETGPHKLPLFIQ